MKTKKVAIVGENTEHFAQLSKALARESISARQISMAALGAAPQDVDLVIGIGDEAKDGGVAIAEAIAGDAKKVAIMIDKGSFAARIEAHRRSFIIIESSWSESKLTTMLESTLGLDAADVSVVEPLSVSDLEWADSNPPTATLAKDEVARYRRLSAREPQSATRGTPPPMPLPPAPPAVMDSGEGPAVSNRFPSAAAFLRDEESSSPALAIPSPLPGPATSQPLEPLGDDQLSLSAEDDAIGADFEDVPTGFAVKALPEPDFEDAPTAYGAKPLPSLEALPSQATKKAPPALVDDSKPNQPQLPAAARHLLNNMPQDAHIADTVALTESDSAAHTAALLSSAASSQSGEGLPPAAQGLLASMPDDADIGDTVALSASQEARTLALDAQMLQGGGAQSAAQPGDDAFGGPPDMVEPGFAGAFQTPPEMNTPPPVELPEVYEKTVNLSALDMPLPMPSDVSAGASPLDASAGGIEVSSNVAPIPTAPGPAAIPSTPNAASASDAEAGGQPAWFYGVVVVISVLIIAALGVVFMNMSGEDERRVAESTPAAAEPEAAEPAAAEPAAAEPAAAEPAAAEPAAAEPVAAEPAAAEPAAAEPAAAEPAAADSESTAAAVETATSAQSETEDATGNDDETAVEAAPSVASASETSTPASTARDESGSPRERSDAVVREAREAQRANRLAQAKRLYQEAIAMYDANPHAHAGLAQVAIDLGEATLAVEEAQRAARLRRRRASYQVLLGDAFRAAGQQGRATQAYRRALEISPNDRTARSRLSGN